MASAGSSPLPLRGRQSARLQGRAREAERDECFQRVDFVLQDLATEFNGDEKEQICLVGANDCQDIASLGASDDNPSILYKKLVKRYANFATATWIVMPFSTLAVAGEARPRWSLVMVKLSAGTFHEYCFEGVDPVALTGFREGVRLLCACRVSDEPAPPPKPLVTDGQYTRQLCLAITTSIIAIRREISSTLPTRPASLSWEDVFDVKYMSDQSAYVDECLARSKTKDDFPGLVQRYDEDSEARGKGKEKDIVSDDEDDYDEDKVDDEDKDGDDEDEDDEDEDDEDEDDEDEDEAEDEAEDDRPKKPKASTQPRQASSSDQNRATAGDQARLLKDDNNDIAEAMPDDVLKEMEVTSEQRMLLQKVEEGQVPSRADRSAFDQHFDQKVREEVRRLAQVIEDRSKKLPAQEQKVFEYLRLYVANILEASDRENVSTGLHFLLQCFRRCGGLQDYLPLLCAGAFLQEVLHALGYCSQADEVWVRLAEEDEVMRRGRRSFHKSDEHKVWRRVDYLLRASEPHQGATASEEGRYGGSSLFYGVRHSVHMAKIGDETNTESFYPEARLQFGRHTIFALADIGEEYNPIHLMIRLVVLILNEAVVIGTFGTLTGCIEGANRWRSPTAHNLILDSRPSALTYLLTDKTNAFNVASPLAQALIVNRWTTAEDDIVINGYTQKDRKRKFIDDIVLALARVKCYRSYYAVATRAAFLGLAERFTRWSTEVHQLAFEIVLQHLAAVEKINFEGLVTALDSHRLKPSDMDTSQARRFVSSALLKHVCYDGIDAAMRRLTVIQTKYKDLHQNSDADARLRQLKKDFTKLDVLRDTAPDVAALRDEVGIIKDNRPTTDQLRTLIQASVSLRKPAYPQMFEATGRLRWGFLRSCGEKVLLARNDDGSCQLSHRQLKKIVWPTLWKRAGLDESHWKDHQLQDNQDRLKAFFPGRSAEEVAVGLAESGPDRVTRRTAGYRHIFVQSGSRYSRLREEWEWLLTTKFSTGPDIGRFIVDASRVKTLLDHFERKKKRLSLGRDDLEGLVRQKGQKK